MMSAIIASRRSPVAAGLEKLTQQGGSRRRPRADVAFLDHHTSNEPIGPINGRPKRYAALVLGFRYLTATNTIPGIPSPQAALCF